MDQKKTWPLLLPLCLRLELVPFLKNRFSVNMDTSICVFPFVSKPLHFCPPATA